MNKPFSRLLAISATVVACVAGTGCANMTAPQKGAAIGAAAGGVAGSVLTNGSGLGTVGGAAVGGVIGHEVGKNHR